MGEVISLHGVIRPCGLNRWHLALRNARPYAPTGEGGRASPFRTFPEHTSPCSPSSTGAASSGAPIGTGYARPSDRPDGGPGYQLPALMVCHPHGRRRSATLLPQRPAFADADLTAPPTANKPTRLSALTGGRGPCPQTPRRGLNRPLASPYESDASRRRNASFRSSARGRFAPPAPPSPRQPGAQKTHRPPPALCLRWMHSAGPHTL